MSAEAGRDNPGRLAFLLSPRSSSHCQIDTRLFERPRFQEVLEACDTIIRDELGWSFHDGLASDGVAYRRRLTEAEFEPAVTALQIAMVDLWRGLGVSPDAVAGASGGEYAAACVAGALSLEDAMRVACCTGHAFTLGLGHGRTITVNMTREDAEAYLRTAPTMVYLAAHYSESNVALSGEAAAIDVVAADLSTRNVRWRPVPTGMAVHSPLMDALENVFMQRLSRLHPRPPRLPIYSAAAGGLARNAVLDARYWWFVFRQPAYLADAARWLVHDGFDAFVDFGLQPVLSGAIGEAAKVARKPVRILAAVGAPGGATVEDGLRDLAAHRAPVPAPAEPAGAGRPAFDPASPDVRRDPYPHYHRLRASAPVLYLPSVGYWAVLTHAEATGVLRDPAVFSSSILRSFDSTLIGADPPAHTRARRLVSDAFTPSKMAALEAHIRARTDQLLDGIAGKTAFDVVATVAVPLPVSVIAELLGMGTENLGRLKRWTDAVVAGASGRPVADERSRLAAVAAEMERFLADHIASLQAGPSGSLLGDLVGAGRLEPRLAASEAASLARLLLVAGNETTTNLIGNTLRALLRNPAELAQIQRDRTLVPDAIEEALRYDAPVQTVDRVTTQSVELGGVRIPAQARIGVMIGAANRDPSEFVDPDTFSIARRSHSHLAFGAGPHYCLGSSLSRLEARIVVEGLLDRLPHLRAAQSLDEVELSRSLHLRGPRVLMLAGPAGA